MNFITIDKKDWASGIKLSQKTYQLFGPVKHQNKFLIQKLEDDQLPEMECQNTIMSVKSVLFPQTEKMFDSTLNEAEENHHILQRAYCDYSLRAVLGIRPYDAKAIELVKLNFITQEYVDPYWKDAYDATTFIGLAISKPGPCDFSSSAGCGPFSETGLDILLADMDDHYLAKILTEKGEAYAVACGFQNFSDAKQGQVLFDILRKEAEKNIVSTIETDKLKEKTILELHEAPFWDDLAFSCINCGTCTYVCPTCWCFDIQDETKNKHSIRYRNWDTCMASLFTHHSSGHNPRATKVQRVRQRFMHKLKYFLDKYDQGIMCVGCGRCVKSCPVNIDIREVCNMMNAYEKQD
ncbi:MAG: 4Fe-4S dicluster domain-containing protein [Pseudomonadota bacterium]